MQIGFYDYFVAILNWIHSDILILQSNLEVTILYLLLVLKLKLNFIRSVSRGVVVMRRQYKSKYFYSSIKKLDFFLAITQKLVKKCIFERKCHIASWHTHIWVVDKIHVSFWPLDLSTKMSIANFSYLFYSTLK